MEVQGGKSNGDFYPGLPRSLFTAVTRYRTAGNIGGQLNLAVWRLGKRPSNLSAIYATYVLFYVCACAHIIYMELLPNLNPPIFLFRPLRTKPLNLKIANISGYTVYNESSTDSV